MKCSNCGADVTETASFCPRCGKPVEVNQGVKEMVCPACNAEVPEGTNFCPQCGKPLNPSISNNPYFVINGKPLKRSDLIKIIIIALIVWAILYLIINPYAREALFRDIEISFRRLFRWFDVFG